MSFSVHPSSAASVQNGASRSGGHATGKNIVDRDRAKNETDGEDGLEGALETLAPKRIFRWRTSLEIWFDVISEPNLQTLVFMQR